VKNLHTALKQEEKPTGNLITTNWQRKNSTRKPLRQARKPTGKNLATATAVRIYDPMSDGH
jgi:hypothetical protein